MFAGGDVEKRRKRAGNMLVADEFETVIWAYGVTKGKTNKCYDDNQTVGIKPLTIFTVLGSTAGRHYANKRKKSTFMTFQKRKNEEMDFWKVMSVFLIETVCKGGCWSERFSWNV